MRFSILFILSVLLLETIGFSRLPQTSGQGPNAVASQKTGLELSYSVVESKYCDGGGMLLILSPEYKNTGQSDVVIFKYALAPFEYRVSKSVAAAKAKRHEQVISPMIGSGPSRIDFGAEPSPDYFTTLKPGQSFSPVNTVTVVIFTAGANQKREKGDLGPGNHVLELKSSTWPFDGNNDVKAELQVRWKRFGTLWTEPLLSLPIAFQVDRVNDRSLSNCNAPAPR